MKNPIKSVSLALLAIISMLLHPALAEETPVSGYPENTRKSENEESQVEPHPTRGPQAA